MASLLEAGRVFPFDLALRLVTALDSNQFGILSPKTRAFTFVGNTPYLIRITSAGVAGGFYGANSGGDLYRLTTSGQSTLIGGGTVTLDTFDADVPDGIGYGFSADTHDLYSISLSTGAETLIGPTGIPPLFSGVSDGTAYDARNGQLYLVYAPSPSGVDLLYDLNTKTGAATVIGSTGIGGLLAAGGIFTPVVPEASSLALLALGLPPVGLAVARRRRDA